MPVAIRKITPPDYIKQALEVAVQREMQIIIRRIAFIATQAVNLQRDLGEEYRGLSAKQLQEKRKSPHTPNYIDDTGNLRNSIGFLIALDGEPITEDFKGGAAKELAQSALSEHPKGIALILTAGMEYAAAVSSKGYDVLDTAEIFCKKSFEDMLSKYRK